MRKAGIPEEQAETIVEMTKTAVNDAAAAKADLNVLESRAEPGAQALRDTMDAGNQALREEWRAGLEQMGTRIIRWIVGTSLVAAGMIIAAMKL